MPSEYIEIAKYGVLSLGWVIAFHKDKQLSARTKDFIGLVKEQAALEAQVVATLQKFTE